MKVKTSYLHVEGQIATPLETYKSCQDCARLKALLGDLWEFLEDYEREKWNDLVTKYQELEARIKQERILNELSKCT